MKDKFDGSVGCFKNEVDLEEIACNNYIKAINAEWLDNHAAQFFTKTPDVRFLAITETPPRTLYTFESKQELLQFILKYPCAAFRYRGFEKEIWML